MAIASSTPKKKISLEFEFNDEEVRVDSGNSSPLMRDSPVKRQMEKSPGFYPDTDTAHTGHTSLGCKVSACDLSMYRAFKIETVVDCSRVQTQPDNRDSPYTMSRNGSFLDMSHSFDHRSHAGSSQNSFSPKTLKCLNQSIGELAGSESSCNTSILSVHSNYSFRKLKFKKSVSEEA